MGMAQTKSSQGSGNEAGVCSQCRAKLFVWKLLLVCMITIFNKVVGGKVVKKQTTQAQIKGHKVAASNDNPQYIVRSDKSGKAAAHKPSELKKV
jgi:hypothetical protein